MTTPNAAMQYNKTEAPLFGGLHSTGDLLTRNARIMPQKLGLVFEDTRLTWKEVNDRANAFAHAMRKRGLKKGDRVALFALNCHQWVEALFGLQKLGCVIVTVNNRLSTPEVQYIVENSGAVGLITTEPQAETAWNVASQIKAITLLIGIGFRRDGFLEYETLVAEGDTQEPALDTPLTYDDPAMLLYTSGTTGFPKGAIYTHGSTLIGMFIHVHAIASREPHRVMLPSPLYSGAGIAGIFCAIYVGSSSFLLNFEAQKALQLIEREKITFTNLVPTTIQMLLSRDDIDAYDLSSLQTMIYGGAPISVPVLKLAAKKLPNCRFRQTFAATETGCAGTVLEPEDHWQALNTPGKEHLLLSCGKPQTNVDVQVFDEKGDPAPAGEIGEIGIRTEANISGFWDNPQATRESIRNGWVFAGDIGRMDEDGYIYLIDRKKDLIVSGALNVYPSEVERVLQQHEGIYEAAVIGVPSEKWGEAVKAVIVAKEGHTLTEQDIINFCDGKLAGFKKPKSVDFVDSLPHNATGKILRRALRDYYWETTERRI